MCVCSCVEQDTHKNERKSKHTLFYRLTRVCVCVCVCERVSVCVSESECVCVSESVCASRESV